MSAHTISASRPIPAPAATVYNIIADYRTSHPAICPPGHFRDFVVERGGVGAGTILNYEFVFMGAGNRLRMEVLEPEPGRVLVERYFDSGNVTTFTVEPRDTGRACHVTIETALGGHGLRGAVERMISKRILPPIFAEELARLEAYATGTGPFASRAPAEAAPADATRVATPAHGA